MRARVLYLRGKRRQSGDITPYFAHYNIAKLLLELRTIIRPLSCCIVSKHNRPVRIACLFLFVSAGFTLGVVFGSTCLLHV